MAASAVSALAHKNAALHCWGRDPLYRWWALISWHEYGVLDGGNNGYVFHSAWVPARDLTPSPDPYQQGLYRTLERLDLPAGGNTWPTPASRGHEQLWVHHGPITRPPAATPGLTRLIGIPPARDEFQIDS